jgi:hypothetical protein
MNLNARPRKVWQAYSFKDLRTFLSMGYIKGEGRSQGTLFPVVLDDFVPADRVCGVIDALNRCAAGPVCCHPIPSACLSGRSYRNGDFTGSYKNI